MVICIFRGVRGTSLCADELWLFIYSEVLGYLYIQALLSVLMSYGYLYIQRAIRGMSLLFICSEISLC